MKTLKGYLLGTAARFHTWSGHWHTMHRADGPQRVWIASERQQHYVGGL